jgi:hypothetical protein
MCRFGNYSHSLSNILFATLSFMVLLIIDTNAVEWICFSLSICCPLHILSSYCDFFSFERDGTQNDSLVQQPCHKNANNFLHSLFNGRPSLSFERQVSGKL